MGKHLILTGFDKNMANVGGLTHINHKTYADRHGFDFQVVREYLPNMHPSWQKLRLLMERIGSFDSILWIDADAIVTNLEFDFTSLIADRKGLILSKDWENHNYRHYFSAGVLIVVSGSESVEILGEAMLNRKWENVPLWDQAALQDVFQQRTHLQPYFNVMPRRCLNAVAREVQIGSIEPWQKGDFISHLTGINNSRRMELLSKYGLKAGEP